MKSSGTHSAASGRNEGICTPPTKRTRVLFPWGRGGYARQALRITMPNKKVVMRNVDVTAMP